MMKLASLKSKLLIKAVLPFADLVTRQRVMASYRFFRESQWWSRERLIQYQESRLRETLQIAYSQVPFYKEYYDRHGVRINEILNKSDLVKIPPVSKEDLRRAYPDFCVRKTRYPVYEFFTSGSSGQPFAVKVDSRTLSDARALMFLRANFSGWEIGEPFLQTGMTLKRGAVKWAKDILLGVKYVSAFNLSDTVLDSYLSIIEKRRIKYVMGYPGSIYFLAKRARQVGFNHRLRGIICWGDNLYRHYRREMEEVFGCRATDTYGCGEGIQVAAQCKHGLYHIFMPHVIVEVVDEYGAPVPAGCMGNILLTRLDPGAMPLIRYRVGDIGKKNDMAHICSCGRGLEVMDAIDGRDCDVIVTPSGNRLIVHFFTGIFEYYPSIENFKIIQETPDAIHVQIVPGPGFLPEHWDQIKKQILEKGDPDLKIEMEVVKEISLESSGKRRFVISRLKDQTNGTTLKN